MKRIYKIFLIYGQLFHEYQLLENSRGIIYLLMYPLCSGIRLKSTTVATTHSKLQSCIVLNMFSQKPEFVHYVEIQGVQ